MGLKNWPQLFSLLNNSRKILNAKVFLECKKFSITNILNTYSYLTKKKPSTKQWWDSWISPKYFFCWLKEPSIPPPHTAVRLLNFAQVFWTLCPPSEPCAPTPIQTYRCSLLMIKNYLSRKKNLVCQALNKEKRRRVVRKKTRQPPRNSQFLLWTSDIKPNKVILKRTR